MRRLTSMFGGGTHRSSPRHTFESLPKPSPWARVAVIMICLLVLSAVKQLTDNSGHIHREFSDRDSVELSNKAARLLSKRMIVRNDTALPHPPLPPTLPPTLPPSTKAALSRVPKKELSKRSKVNKPFGTGTVGVGNTTVPAAPQADETSAPVSPAKQDLLAHNSGNISESKNVSASLALANALLAESSDSVKFD